MQQENMKIITIKRGDTPLDSTFFLKVKKNVWNKAFGRFQRATYSSQGQVMTNVWLILSFNLYLSF